ncbi:MAG: glycosyltransferase family 2 protein [Candidatus Acidiferrum sp.]|jgi:glycosyltransferase involved in cell wall biosynthesis
MHLAFYLTELSFFGFVAIFWVFYGLRVVYGALRLPWVKDFFCAPDAECPRISLLFAARDEEEKLPAALASLAAIDYPDLEIIAVDDRSTDATARILDDFAAAHPRFRVVHVKELPAGWLGKPHALQQAYEASHGEWLIFTDADVWFKSDVVRRSVSIAREKHLEHLTLFCDIQMVGFWERVLITFFGLWFHMATDPHGVSNPRSAAYVGVGAFQMLKRSAYEAAGTHRRLAMEVVDDMKLGKIVKMAGFRSGVAVARDFLSVRWHAGAGNLIRGVTKNFFAGASFSVSLVVLSIVGTLLLNVVPFAALPFLHSWALALALVSVAIMLAFHAGVDIVMRVSPLYALTFPLGALILAYMLLRSTLVTLRQGGIIWRDTFYPLEELRRGLV